jgi:hypothetical protein
MCTRGPRLVDAGAAQTGPARWKRNCSAAPGLSWCNSSPSRPCRCLRSHATSGGPPATLRGRGNCFLPARAAGAAPAAGPPARPDPPAAVRSNPAELAAPVGSHTCAGGRHRTAAGAWGAYPASVASPAGRTCRGGGLRWGAASRCKGQRGRLLPPPVDVMGWDCLLAALAPAYAAGGLRSWRALGPDGPGKAGSRGERGGCQRPPPARPTARGRHACAPCPRLCPGAPLRLPLAG